MVGRQKRTLAKPAMALWMLGATSIAACGGQTIVVNNIEIYERNWAQAVQQVSARATFDLNCPREQLQFALFARAGRHATQVGVEGCGMWATYVRTVVPYASGPWHLDATLQQAAPVAAEPAPVPAPAQLGSALPAQE